MNVCVCVCVCHSQSVLREMQLVPESVSAGLQATFIFNYLSLIHALIFLCSQFICNISHCLICIPW